MGTVHHASGAITFDPPVNAAELRSVFHAFTVPEECGFSVQLATTEEAVETDDGTMTRRYANQITPTWTNDGPDVGYYGNRNIPEDLAELVVALGSDRTYQGAIEVCADIAHADDFEAYRLTVGIAADLPAVYRTNATVAWGHEPANYIPRKATR